MEAYPGDPYAYMPSGGGGIKGKFHNIEGVLPLILLIVIAFFVLQFLHIIPCMIPIGCGGDVTVGVIGVPSPGVQRVLTSDQARFKNIKYAINIPPSVVVNENTLKSYRVLILQGDPYFNMNTREAVKKWVDAGGKLIVIGDAGSKHPDPAYKNVAGWSWPSGNGIPVPAKLTGELVGLTDIAHGLDLRFVKFDHPIAVGLQMVGARLDRPDVVYKVVQTGDMIAAIETSEGTW
ncbi:MAG: hypothetical protein JXB14_06310, partial [Candidatus Altiarchaeota archaeon]|nr:hypothetical protein [Candidatus Altiarchaeota archaeon]